MGLNSMIKNIGICNLYDFHHFGEVSIIFKSYASDLQKSVKSVTSALKPIIQRLHSNLFQNREKHQQELFQKRQRVFV